MLIHACILAGIIAGADAGSLDDSRARLTAELTDHIYVALGLGDSARAVRAFGVLAAVSENEDALLDMAYRLLNVCGDAGLPRDTRANLLSHDAAVREKALQQVVDQLAARDREHPVPADLRGLKVLGAADGCPIEYARAFAAGPAGAVLALSDGLVTFDGTRWRMIPDTALRVSTPAQTVYVDRSGRTWLATIVPRARAAADERAARRMPADRDPNERIAALLVNELELMSRGTFAYFEPGPGGVPLRWHVFGGSEGIASIAESKSALWLASHGRLFVFEDNVARPVVCPLPYSPRRTLVAGPQSDEIWVVDIDRVSRYDGRKWESLRMPGGAPAGGTMTKSGPAILLSSGLLLPAGGKYALIDGPKDAGELVALAAGADGRIWCVSATGSLALLNAERSEWKLWKAPAGLTPRGRPALLCDSADRLWLSRGRGVELCVGEPAPDGVTRSAAQTRDAAVEKLALQSAAGSGGWTEDAVLMEAPPTEDARTGRGPRVQPDVPDDLGGFAEDEGKGPATPKGLLDDLRKSPGASGMFNRLLIMLAKEPDPVIRAEALTLGVKGQNQAFFSNPSLVSECTETMLDEGRAVEAYVVLLEAWCRNTDERYRAVIEPTVCEALVTMGFGEFARPDFLRRDLVPVIRLQTTLGHMPSSPRAVSVGLAFEAGENLFKAADMPVPRILVLKRRVLAAPGDAAPWKSLVDEALRLGDAGSIQLNDDCRQATSVGAAVGSRSGPPASDSTVLSPYRWIRRVRLGLDSGIAPVASDDSLHVYDEGSGIYYTLKIADGKVRNQETFAPLSVCAVLGGDGAPVVVAKAKGGGISARVWRDAKTADWVAVDGLTEAFDGFSCTPVRDGVFYCFDSGLTKVDLKAKKAAWRNPDITGGMNGWRSLLERSLPVADGEDVLVHLGCKVFCVSAASGELRWAKDAGVACTPCLVGPVAVVNAARGEVWGLDRRSGEPKWKHIASGETLGAFVSDGERIFFAARDGDVTALDAATGEFLWRRPTDISFRRPVSRFSKPTALVVRGDLLAACNQFGYVEFDRKTGAIVRRLDLTTGRPMLDTKDGIIVSTDPDRFVMVVAPAKARLADRVAAIAGALKGRLADDLLSLAEAERAAGRTKNALGILRLAAYYIEPEYAAFYASGLEWSVGAEAAQAEPFYLALLGNTDIFGVRERELMRRYADRAPKSDPAAERAFELVAIAHQERGGSREAALALERIARPEPNPAVARALIRLQVSSGDEAGALRTAESLAATGLRGAEVAFAALAGAGLEEKALALAAPRAGPREALPLLLAAVGVSERAGLFERAREMLDRSAGLMPRPVRGLYLAYLVSGAGVTDRVLKRDGQEIRRRIDEYRGLLAQRRDVLRELNQPDALKAVTDELERLDKQPFP